MSKLLVSLVAAGCLSAAAADLSSIGFARSSGEFRVDGTTLRGNSTLFAGTVIETGAAESVIQLSRAQVTLAPDSRARIFPERTVLEKGTATLRDTERHVFEAASLRISPAGGESAVQVDVLGPSRISVLAVAGGALVRNSAGLLAGRLNAGMALAFDTPGSSGSTALQMTGMVTLQDGRYFLTDATSHVTVELRGGNMSAFVGKEVEITGSVVPNATPAAGASEVAQVAAVHAVKSGRAAKTGLSAAAKISLIGGVAVAATVGGLAAVGEFSSASISAK